MPRYRCSGCCTAAGSTHARTARTARTATSTEGPAAVRPAALPAVTSKSPSTAGAALSRGGFHPPVEGFGDPSQGSAGSAGQRVSGSAGPEVSRVSGSAGTAGPEVSRVSGSAGTAGPGVCGDFGLTGHELKGLEVRD
jgi:hypothetical protein